MSLSAPHEKYQDQNQLHANDRLFTSYVISDVDGSNKESRNYGPCTGIVAVGLGKDGKNISLLTHHAPMAFDKDDFFEGVADRLRKLQEEAVPGTVDVVIIGGNEYERRKFFIKNTDDSEYKKIAGQLAKLSRDILKVEPRLFGPVVDNFTSSGATSVLLDTENRRLHMLRTEGKAAGDDFDRLASEVLKDKK